MKSYKFWLIVSMVLFLGVIGLMISIRSIDKQTKATTTCYSATVERIQITDTGENFYTEIRTKEHKTVLHISTVVGKNIDMNNLYELKKGDVIFFRIENYKLEQMNEVDFLSIVSLQTDTTVIFSLEDYNEFVNASAYPARILCGIISVVCLSISMLNLFRIVRNRKAK